MRKVLFYWRESEKIVSGNQYFLVDKADKLVPSSVFLSKANSNLNANRANLNDRVIHIFWDVLPRSPNVWSFR